VNIRGTVHEPSRCICSVPLNERAQESQQEVGVWITQKRTRLASGWTRPLGKLQHTLCKTQTA